MSAQSLAASAVQTVARAGSGLLFAAATICPFDGVLSGMIRAGLGIEAICACLGLSRSILDYNLVRLDLPTPHDRPRRKGTRRAWQDAELRCAIFWRHRGVHPESIGLVFGRSASAVRAKMHRLGIPAPDRKTLHKADPATLRPTLPEFGFPVPPAERVSAPTAPASPVANSAAPNSVCTLTERSDRPGPLVEGPADLIARFQIAGAVRRPDADKAYLTWLTLLYRGGMHYKAMATFLGRSPSAVQAILYRMQIPRANSRRNFGPTCDLECAVAELAQWDFELQRCTNNPALAEDEQPWFWRHKDDRGNRKRRCSRLKNKEIDSYFKYKDGNSVEIMTRAQLEAQRRVEHADASRRNPARLHAAMRASRPIQQGAAHEQLELRGHAPAVRPGLPGDARNEMSWAYHRDGRAARTVARP